MGTTFKRKWERYKPRSKRSHEWNEQRGVQGGMFDPGVGMRLKDAGTHKRTHITKQHEFIVGYKLCSDCYDAYLR